MAYYSNQGTNIHSGAAGYGLLQSYKDGSLGVMATMVSGGHPPMESGMMYIPDPKPAVHSIYHKLVNQTIRSTYSKPVRSVYSKVPMWKVPFRIDNTSYNKIGPVSAAVRKDGGQVLEYKLADYGSGYGTMLYPKNLAIYRTWFFGGVPVVILGSTKATATDLRGLGHGPLRSYKDGVLGGLGESPLQSYHDGVLGGLGGSLQAYQDGSLGMLGSGPLMSYQDGSLGYPLTLETSSGIQTLEDPVVIRHGTGEYFNATGEYFSGTSGCSSCGLGQAATLPVLNLSDPQVMKELKTAMLVAPWILVNLQNAADQVEADALDPNWTPFTTQIAEGWMQGYGPWMVSKLGGQTQGATAEEYTAAAQKGFVPPEQIPNALGVQAIFSVLEVIFLGEDGQGKNALMTPDQFPNLVSFVGAVRANNGEGEVSFMKKGLFAQASAMQLGLGAVVLGSLLYLAFGTKKRRK